ncbi:hypothetical protein MBLNU457_3267t2 [Dothideomycetes sp. NU457]
MMEGVKTTTTIVLDDKAFDQLETAYERHTERISRSSEGSRDRRDMARMGRRVELKRCFDIFTSIGYSAVVSSSWEISMVSVMYSIINGGLAGTFWIFIVAASGMFATTLSMAEMASMAPTEGAQYHWVSELAPRRIQKFLSFLVGGFCFVVVVTWVMGPREEAKVVFTQFSAASGWGDVNIGLACLVGLGPPLTILAGADSACHVAEEVRNAARAVPRAMVATSIINSLMGLVIVLTFVFNIGNTDSVLYPEHILSYVSVFYTATQSVAATYFCVSLMAVLLCFCAVNRATSASRQLYAFARDAGLPFSSWLSHVGTGSAVPQNSIMASALLSTLIILVVIGSQAAWQYISTTATSCILLSYWIAIAVLLWRKLSGGKLPTSQYHLGLRRGIMINIFSLAFLTLALVFSFFPTRPWSKPSAINWNVVVVPAAIIFCSVYYAFHGRYYYKAPVEKVKK